MGRTAQIIVILASILGICFPPELKAAAKKGISASGIQGHQLIPEAKFRQIFKGYLCRRLGKEKSDVLVSRFKVLGNKPIPPGERTFQLYQKNKRTLEGHVRLVSIVSVNGVVKNKVRLSSWVDVFEPVVCASRHLKKGEMIERDAVHLERKNISRLSSKILTDITKVVGLMAKHHVKEGTCLKTWMLEESPIVKRGDIVTIIAESVDLKVTVPGRVLEKGYLGKRVRVQNSMSKKNIYARVMNHSTVMVEF